MMYFKMFPGRTVNIWVGGLRSGGGGGKIIDMAEWNFSVVASSLQDRGVDVSERGVGLANEGAAALRKAVGTYFGAFEVDNKHIPYNQARTRYWSELDGQHGVLLEIARDLKSRLAEAWYPVVRKAMHSAYAYVCPCGTPREISAFAKARERLRLKKPEE
jgi:hypothetical protein